MTATLDALRITEPGVYDMPNETYHADPVPDGSLSSTGARRLLPPSCPARFRYERDNPPAPKPVFELGHAAHKLVLGVGPELVRIDADEWRSNVVKAQVAEVREAGKVPLRPADYTAVHDMAAALREHPYIGRLFHPDAGRAEQSLFWRDHEQPVWRRARLDWLPTPQAGRRLIVADYKTCTNASYDALQRAIATYGYHQQAAWYLDAVKALGLADDPQFVLVFQEKTPPYLVNVAQSDAVAMRIGARLNRQAIRTYRRCVAADRWPGYSDDVEQIPLPAYIENRHAEEYQ